MNCSRLRSGGNDADFVLDDLQPQFSAAELEQRLAELDQQLATRPQGKRIISMINHIAARTYAVEFDAASALNERVLMPSMAAESNGMEDARFVRFTDDDDADESVYYATYTAYNGTEIAQQLLETTDFRRFTSTPLVGPAAANKGLALFPRRISRPFRCLVAFGPGDQHHRHVGRPAPLDRRRVPARYPARAWEVLQLGNCGSPIETEQGWLVLTHGVGPMRTYNIGALLLDLEEPTRFSGNCNGRS